MLVLGLVQSQRPGQPVQHGLRRSGDVAPLETCVVVDADPGQRGHFLTPQAGDAAPVAVGAQAELVRLEPCAAAAQEVPDVGTGIHAFDGTTR